MSKTVSIFELSIIFQRIIDKLQFEEISEMNVSIDFYKYIPTDEWASLSNDVIEIGSLSDDIDNLKRLVVDKNRPCTYVDFDRLASLLRAISQLNNEV